MSRPTPPRPPAALRVRVPASTSNLGPGFDALGVALSLALDVQVEMQEDGPESGPSFHGLTGTAAGWPADANDLLVRAFEAARGAGEGISTRFAFRVRSEIPLARGLGSSGAAVAAGLLLGNAVRDPARGPLDDAGLLALGVALEGHPDNVAPALLGGARLAVPGAGPAGAPLVLERAVHRDLAFALAWPEATVSTHAARAVLPTSVPLADAVENARRLVLLLEGLATGDPVLLAAGSEDRLHVPHRLPLIAGAREALAAARDAGAPLATISGSGSALVAVVARTRAADVAEAMAAELRVAASARHGAADLATARVLEVVRERPAVAAVPPGTPF